MGRKKSSTEKRRKELAARNEGAIEKTELTQERAKTTSTILTSKTQAGVQPDLVGKTDNDDLEVVDADGEADKIDRSISLEEVMSDWSETGRGSHVDFGTDEDIPLSSVRSLGRGAMGDVFEVRVRGYRVAWKRIIAKRKLILDQMKELDVLKKLNHTHIIRLMGTYTHRLQLGLLLSPVAVCDLYTFFDDVETYWANDADNQQKARLTALEYPLDHNTPYKAGLVYSQVRCLISAIDYLHSQKIRHKDLKPSNVLLTPRRLYVSDFGSATDFSLLSQSATDSVKGTFRYFAPEVAEFEPSGRAADIFSLGCVLLEILVLHQKGTLEHLRWKKNPAFHAHLDEIDVWLSIPDNLSVRRYLLLRDIRAMLSNEPEHRPSAQKLLTRASLSDKMMQHTGRSLFGNCCRIEYVTKLDHTEQIHALELNLDETKERLASSESQVTRLKVDLLALENRYEEAQSTNRALEARHRETLEASKYLGRLNLAQKTELSKAYSETNSVKKRLKDVELQLEALKRGTEQEKSKDPHKPHAVVNANQHTKVVGPRTASPIPSPKAISGTSKASVDIKEPSVSPVQPEYFAQHSPVVSILINAHAGEPSLPLVKSASEKKADFVQQFQEKLRLQEEADKKKVEY